MTDQFHLQSGSLPGLAGIHQDVVAALGQVTGAAPEASSLAASHGPIASAVYGALGTTLPRRLGTLQVTSTSAQTISDLLRQADRLYDGGDQQGAEKLRAAAEALENAAGGNPAGGSGAADSASGGSGAAGTGTTSPTGAGGSADQAGQMAGQVGQQVGQIAGTLAQSVQGLLQGLAQLPQQVMQGVQGIRESAAESEGSAAAKADDTKKDDDKAEDSASDEKRHPAPTQTEGAKPGLSADSGRSPEPPAAGKPAEPAQTRPQQVPR